MHTKRSRLAGEVGFVALLVAASGFLLWTAYGISGFTSLTSAGAFPMFTATVMLISGLFSLRHTLRTQPVAREPGESATLRFARQLTPPVLAGFTVAIVAYMVALEPLGFLLASFLFLLVSMRLLGSRRWLLNLAVAALSLAATYLVFQTLFSVVLPAGSWWKGVL